MSELTFFLIRIAYLAILWIFVIAAVSIVRSDMFGARVADGGRVPRGVGGVPAVGAPGPVAQRGPQALAARDDERRGSKAVNSRDRRAGAEQDDLRDRLLRGGRRETHAERESDQGGEQTQALQHCFTTRQ